MGLTFEYSIEISAHPDVVFDVISDIANLHKVLVEMEPAKEYRGGRLEVGDRWLVPQTLGDETYGIEYEVTELGAPKQMEWAVTSPFGVSVAVWNISESISASRLNLYVRVTLLESTDTATRESWSSSYDRITATNMERIKAVAERASAQP